MVLDFSSQLAISNLFSSVVDQDQDPPDPYVFGPPGSGSGSINTRYGSGSFCRQAKIVRKPLIPTVLLILLDVLSFEIDVNVPFIKSIGNKQKNCFKKIIFFVSNERSTIKIAGSGSISQRHGSPDPDANQAVIDPQNCFLGSKFLVFSFIPEKELIQYEIKTNIVTKPNLLLRSPICINLCPLSHVLCPLSPLLCPLSPIICSFFRSSVPCLLSSFLHHLFPVHWH
jgi:hypothetical protein